MIRCIRAQLFYSLYPFFFCICGAIALILQFMDKAQLDKLVIREDISILLQGGQFCMQRGDLPAVLAYLFPELGYLILQRLDALLDCLDYEILELSIGQGDELL